MMATLKSTISTLSRPFREATPESTLFLDEDLASIPAARIPEEIRKLSGFVPIIVLIPKSAVRDSATRNGLAMKKSVTALPDVRDTYSPLDAAMAWFKVSGDSDVFAFGEVTVKLSTMEAHRNGALVILTCKEFRTLAYLIKNAYRVISRDELLNQVWGYRSYPSTRTVDNHILQLRRKLEAEPRRPKHFRTIHGSGYKFVP